MKVLAGHQSLCIMLLVNYSIHSHILASNQKMAAEHLGGWLLLFLTFKQGGKHALNLAHLSLFDHFHSPLVALSRDQARKYSRDTVLPSLLQMLTACTHVAVHPIPRPCSPCLSASNPSLTLCISNINILLHLIHFILQGYMLSRC